MPAALEQIDEQTAIFDSVETALASPDVISEPEAGVSETEAMAIGGEAPVESADLVALGRGRLDVRQAGVAALKDKSRHVGSPDILMTPDMVGAVQDAISKFWNSKQSVDDVVKALQAALKG